MPPQVIACVLSFVLFWCGLHSHEEPTLPTLVPDHSSAFIDATSQDRIRGTLDDHHLDDVPGLADAWSELLGPMPAPSHAEGLMPRLSQPAALAQLPMGSPYLEGLLRPPQAPHPIV